MRSPRTLATFALLLAVLGTPLSAHAQVACERVDPSTQEVARATLTLDLDSVTAKAFGRSTAPATLLLRFKAAGCRLTADSAVPTIEIQPKSGVDELPTNAVSVLRVNTDAAAGEYSVRLALAPKAFDPGSYAGYLELRAPELSTSRTPIEVSRSEHRLWLPVGIGVLGGLAGLLWLGSLHYAKGTPKTFSVPEYLAVFLVAAAVGAVAVLLTYFDQEVWSLNDNGWAAAVTAFTGASTGAMAVTVQRLWGASEPERGASMSTPAASAASTPAAPAASGRFRRREPVERGAAQRDPAEH